MCSVVIFPLPALRAIQPRTVASKGAANQIHPVGQFLYYVNVFSISLQNSGTLPSPSYAPGPPSDMPMGGMQPGFYQV